MAGPRNCAGPEVLYPKPQPFNDLRPWQRKGRPAPGHASLSQGVCIHIIYICTHIHIHMYIYIHMYRYLPTYLYIYIHTQVTLYIQGLSISVRLSYRTVVWLFCIERKYNIPPTSTIPFSIQGPYNRASRGGGSSLTTSVQCSWAVEFWQGRGFGGLGFRLKVLRV